ncbi:MAG: DUF4139 domain-containing protein [Deltaproteobacteria bacterium]|nr:DUF4139 domain-containing protein [Deltaproteobacteria bacterium]
MASRRVVVSSGVVLGISLAVVASAEGPKSQRRSVTIWAATSPTALAGGYGGTTYGGWMPTTGAFVTEQHDVAVGSGEVRIAGVPSTIDPASVHLRDLTDPTGLTISEQRFHPGAQTPTEMLERHVGSAIAVVTAKGEVTGVLRAVDDAVLVIEVGTGDQRRLELLRRDFALSMKLPGTAVDRPSLVWRVATKKPGTHTVELTYRTEGMTWNADYLAILDETGTQIDFSAWATIKNATGASFDDAQLTLVDGATTLQAAAANAYVVPAPRSVPTRYAIGKPVQLGAGANVQVELMPARVAAKVRPIVSYEAMIDQSPNFQQFPNTDCSQFNGAGMGPGNAEIAIELDLPGTAAVPAGRVRLFQRKANGNVDIISEDQLRASAGVARLRLGLDTEITGERHAISCDFDEQKRTLREKIEVKVESKAKRAVDVVIREYLWRTPMFRLEGAPARRPNSGQAEEHRIRLAPGGKQSWTYTVVYTWT